MDIATFVGQVITAAGQPVPANLFTPPNALVQIRKDGAGNYSIPVWNVPNVPAPTVAALTAALAAPQPVASLSAALVAAAAGACDAITAQVNITETHVPAYVNMARWVSQAGGAPTADPYKTSFANFAASLGATPANVATMFQAFDVATPNLLVALNAVKAAAASASATATLNSALSAFETAIGNEVSALNAALTAAGVPTTITTPAAISISGINA